MVLWRVIVKGERVQGVGFRESASHALNKSNIKGFARNLKESGKVELTLLFDGDESALRGLIKGIIGKISEKMPAAEGAEIDRTDRLTDDYTERQISQSERFEVRREDDLHEMVWALQGAGTLFAMATEKIDLLLEFKEEERAMRIASIRCELAHAQEKLQNAKNLELACLKEFIANPLIDIDRDALKRFVEFYYEFAEFREAPEDKRKSNLETMSRKVADMLKRLKELEDGLKGVGSKDS